MVIKLRPHGIILLALLICQYALGMLTNLFVAFPEHVADYQQWDYARSQPLVMAHIILGTLLVLGSLALLVRASRAHDRMWKIASGFGFGSILLALISGSEFISSQQDGYSLVMSLLFICAVASYGWGLYKTKS